MESQLTSYISTAVAIRASSLWLRQGSLQYMAKTTNSDWHLSRWNITEQLCENYTSNKQYII